MKVTKSYSKLSEAEKSYLWDIVPIDTERGGELYSHKCKVAVEVEYDGAAEMLLSDGYIYGEGNPNNPEPELSEGRGLTLARQIGNVEDVYSIRILVEYSSWVHNQDYEETDVSEWCTEGLLLYACSRGDDPDNVEFYITINF